MHSIRIRLMKSVRETLCTQRVSVEIFQRHRFFGAGIQRWASLDLQSRFKAFGSFWEVYQRKR